MALSSYKEELELSVESEKLFQGLLQNQDYRFLEVTRKYTLK